MTRFVLLCLAFAVGAPLACGQDSDEIRRLKKEVELLERELKVSRAENEQLKKENDQLKAAAKGVAAPKAGGPRVLSDMLTEGSTISGDYRFNEGAKAQGNWTLTVMKRSGKDFTGIYAARQTVPTPKNSETAEVEVKGEIDGDRLTFSTANTTKMQATASGFHDKGTINLDWAGRSGKAKMTAKAPK